MFLLLFCLSRVLPQVVLILFNPLTGTFCHCVFVDAVSSLTVASSNGHCCLSCPGQLAALLHMFHFSSVMPPVFCFSGLCANSIAMLYACPSAFLQQWCHHCSISCCYLISLCLLHYNVASNRMRRHPTALAPRLCMSAAPAAGASSSLSRSC